eukprot:2225460-Rhodomonas_salina.6
MELLRKTDGDGLLCCARPEAFGEGGFFAWCQFRNSTKFSNASPSGYPAEFKRGSHQPRWILDRHFEQPLHDYLRSMVSAINPSTSTLMGGLTVRILDRTSRRALSPEKSL